MRSLRRTLRTAIGGDIARRYQISFRAGWSVRTTPTPGAARSGMATVRWQHGLLTGLHRLTVGLTVAFQDRPSR